MDQLQQENDKLEMLLEGYRKTTSFGIDPGKGKLPFPGSSAIIRTSENSPSVSTIKSA